MTCPQCRAANAEGASFCSRCGSPLAAACARCQAPLPPGARFCSNCGAAVTTAPAGDALSAVPAPTPASSVVTTRLEQYIPKELLAKLEAARSARAMEGERRIVTILFCDVQGSTAMAERLDPEEWAEVMNGAFECLIGPVYRYEGTLARLMGDAILAFFGAPIAHEDDPRRAVLAGLGMRAGIQDYRERVRRERALDLNIRIGINTGLVVVGEVGSDLRVEYTAMGDAVNLAARMEQTAAPGTVRIAAATYKAVAPLFEIEPVGAIEVKGKSAPVDAYRVLRAREGAVPTRGIEHLRAPLVGRARELDALRTAAAECASGSGRIVSLIGEAGLGKSRLVAELRQELVAEPRQELENGGQAGAIEWWEGRSFSYETTIPYTPFLRLLGGYFALGDGAADPDAYAGLAAQVDLIAPGRSDDLAPYLATLLGPPLPPAADERARFLMPPQLRGLVFQAVAELIAALAERSPVVLVFEDLHWADATSLDLLSALLPLTERHPLLILALFRPNRDDLSWRFHELAAREYAHRYRSIALVPLDGAHARELVGHLLHIEGLPDAVRALILAKAEGNPFFLEEIIRSLLDAGLVVREGDTWRATREIAALSVPDTLAGVITARLDRLEEGPRRLIQSAAVIGREFDAEVLAAVSDAPERQAPHLNELLRRDLIHELSQRPPARYRFKHVLIQETAYSSMLMSHRRQQHRRVAECLIGREPERPSDIAHHLLEAREPLRALPYLVAAGGHAARTYSTPEAITAYRRALEILDTSPGGEGAATEKDLALARRAFEGLGQALELGGDGPGAAATYRRMLAYAEARDAVPMKVSALNKLAMVLAMSLGQADDAQRCVRDSDRVARAHEDHLGLIELSRIQCGMCLPAGNFTNALDLLGESVDLARRIGSREELAQGLEHFALTLLCMTRFDDAWEVAQEGLAVAGEIGKLEVVADLKTMVIPLAHWTRGEAEAALQVAQEGMDLATRIGAIMRQCQGAIFLGALMAARGEYERALSVCADGQRVAATLGGYAMVYTPHLDAAQILASLDLGLAGYRETAAECAGQIVDMGDLAGAWGWEALGAVALAEGDPARASAWFERGLTQPSMFWLLRRPYLSLGAAAAARATGDLDRAAVQIDEARAFADEHGMAPVGPLAALEQGRLCLARGELASALEHLARARELAAALQMRPIVWQALAETARALTALARADDAEAARAEAQRVITAISAGMTSEHLRAAFAEQAARQLGHPDENQHER